MYLGSSRWQASAIQTRFESHAETATKLSGQVRDMLCEVSDRANIHRGKVAERRQACQTQLKHLRDGRALGVSACNGFAQEAAKSVQEAIAQIMLGGSSDSVVSATRRFRDRDFSFDPSNLAPYVSPLSHVSNG
jgi:hypothetical protein